MTSAVDKVIQHQNKATQAQTKISKSQSKPKQSETLSQPKTQTEAKAVNLAQGDAAHFLHTYHQAFNYYIDQGLQALHGTPEPMEDEDFLGMLRGQLQSDQPSFYGEIPQLGSSKPKSLPSA